jgi:tetratricopeptide (TPR) repeat protein
MAKRFLSILAILLIAFASADVLADPVRVRASVQDGYGRITFRWPAPVGHQAQKQGDQLVVLFSRPIEANLGGVPRTLNRWVAGLGTPPSANSVAFRIKGEFSVRSYDSGTSVVVDIVGAGDAATAPEQPQQQQVVEAPKPAAAQPVGQTSGGSGPDVRVRTGVHADYTRVVFDWPSNTSFKMVRDGDKAILQFAKPGKSNVARLATGQVKNIQGASISSDEGNLAVVLNVAATSQIKAFNSGAKVVVDVYAPGTQAAAPPLAQAPAQPASVPEPKLEPAQPAQAEQPPAPQKVPVSPVEIAEDTGGGETETTSAQAAPLALQPAKPDTPEAAAPAAAEQAGGVEESAAVDTRAEASKVGDVGVALKFNWDEPVGAAVFRRGEDLWVVFDKRANVDTQALLEDGGGLITQVEQVPSRTGAVLRLRTQVGVNPSVKRAGLAWLLEFLPQPLVPTSPLQADAQPDSPLGARLFIAIPEPGNIIAFRDPEIGDNLLAVPVIPLGHGMSRTWSYPQLQLLPTKQGVVVKPKTDDLRVRPLRQGVEVTSKGDLRVSSVSAEAKANVELQQQLASSVGMDQFRELTRILNLEKWKRPDLQNFTLTKQDLQRNIAFADNKRIKKEAQRELMFFLFSNGFQAETIGILNEMVRTDPAYGNDPEFLLVYGAASWLMGRMEDARNVLYNPKLDNNDEAEFWRAAVIAGEGHLDRSALELRQNGAITQPYPKAIKLPMATLVAEAAIELGDVRQANQYLEVLRVDNPTSAEMDQINYVQGKVDEVSGNDEKAIGVWEGVMEGRNRPVRARAAVARTELLLKLSHYSPEDAIEEYEKLRFVWRGDDFEFKVLRRLGMLYLEQQEYRDGLRTLRQAATYFPNHEESNQVTKMMSDTFNALYLEGQADILPPVTAIALYDEFRELTPPGELGDEMIRNLADRLVEVDLLDRAASLLEEQIEFRIKGELKSRVGARLALIHLFDHNFSSAINVLNQTETNEQNDELTAQRVLLRAQAHVGLGEMETALEMLQSEVSQEAELIRTGIYWDQGDWKHASKSLAKLTRLMEIKPRKPVDDMQAAVVLALAISYTLEGNEVAISRVQNQYGLAMSQTQYADPFRLIAEPPETGLVDFRELEPIVEKVTDFQGFMEVYLERVAGGQLSSLY